MKCSLQVWTVLVGSGVHTCLIYCMCVYLCTKMCTLKGDWNSIKPTAKLLVTTAAQCHPHLQTAAQNKAGMCWCLCTNCTNQILPSTKMSRTVPKLALSGPRQSQTVPQCLKLSQHGLNYLQAVLKLSWTDPNCHHLYTNRPTNVSNCCTQFPTVLNYPLMN